MVIYNTKVIDALQKHCNVEGNVVSIKITNNNHGFDTISFNMINKNVTIKVLIVTYVLHNEGIFITIDYNSIDPKIEFKVNW